MPFSFGWITASMRWGLPRASQCSSLLLRLGARHGYKRLVALRALHQSVPAPPAVPFSSTLARPETIMDATAHCPELDEFRSAFGHHCTHAALALNEGHSRDAVRVAFAGDGDNLHLRHLRVHRVEVNQRGDMSKDALTARGLSESEALKAMIAVARSSRDAVEGEWMVTVPVAAAP
jgi:hypothetical protein